MWRLINHEYGWISIDMDYPSQPTGAYFTIVEESPGRGSAANAMDAKPRPGLPTPITTHVGLMRSMGC